MRVTLPRADLARVLTAASKVVEGRNTIPILSNILLTVKGGRFTVRATDLEAEISASIAVLDAIDGAVTVPAKLLGDIAKKASGDVTLELVYGVLEVRSGKARWSLETLPADDFPSFLATGFDGEFEIDLAALVGPVAFAMSNEEVRYYLNGAYLHVVDGRLVAVATDGHRLARHVGHEIADGVVPAAGVILPRKLVSMLPKGPAKVALSPTKVRIITDDAVIVSKLIDGTFPDYQRIIPQNNENRVRVARDIALAAIDRVTVVSTERTRAIRLDVAAGSIGFSVGGKAREDVDAALDGEPLTIGFNSQYLADSLRVLSGNEAVIAMADGGAPAVLTGESDNLLCVIMPMRI